MITSLYKYCLPKGWAYAEVLESGLKFLNFKLADIVLRCFPIGIDQTFDQLSTYHKTRCVTRLYTLLALPENVVNFAVNNSKLCGDSEGGLDIRYGDTLKSMYHQISEIAPLAKEKLKLLQREGVCFGSSLDFIANVFEKNRKNQDLYKTIKKVSALYKDGTTLRAEILQILHCARDKTLPDMMIEYSNSQISDYENAWKLLKQSVENRKRQFLQKENSHQSTESYTEFLQQSCTQLDEIEKQVDKAVKLSQKFLNECRIRNIFSAVSLIGMRASTVFELNYDKNSTTSTEALVDGLNSLENGSYLIRLSTPESSAGHALAYIKESNERSFLFEPNCATFVFNGGEDLKQKALKIINLTIATSATIEFYRCVDTK